jgi:hypothetical protein
LTLSPIAGAAAAEWFVSAQGTPQAQGTRASPWDLASALSGERKVAPGDTIWVLGGTYKHPDRTLGGAGFKVRLVGEEGKPIHVRAAKGERATIDGALTVEGGSKHLWVWDLELIISENATISRTIEEPGSHPTSYGRPWGGLNVFQSANCKYIDLVIHDTAQGVSAWVPATDSEIHGCIIYNNGWKAPDRGHGHAIYTQNQNGVKTISDCLITGGFGYSIHAYGSANAYVDNYLIENNIVYDAGTFLMGGGRPSKNMRSLRNVLYNVGMQLGYNAPYNEDCQVQDNVIVNGGLTIVKFKTADEKNNEKIDAKTRPAGSPPRVFLRPNKYDLGRANLAVLNLGKLPVVNVAAGEFLKAGQKFRLMDPTDFFGKPVMEGVYDGKAIKLPMKGDFAAFVLLKETSKEAPRTESQRSRS